MAGAIGEGQLWLGLPCRLEIWPLMVSCNDAQACIIWGKMDIFTHRINCPYNKGLTHPSQRLHSKLMLVGLNCLQRHVHGRYTGEHIED